MGRRGTQERRAAGLTQGWAFLEFLEHPWVVAEKEESEGLHEESVLIRVSSVFSQKQKQRLGLLLLTARWTLPSSLNVTTAGSGLRGPWGALGFRRGHSGGQIAPSGGTTCLGSGSEKPLGAENAGMEVCRRAFGGTGCLLGLGRDGDARELRLASTPAACVSQFDVGLGGARSPHVWVPPLWAKPRDS